MAKRRYETLHWDWVIFALLKYKNATAAAAALGIDRSTIGRYRQNPAFNRRLFQAQLSVTTEARAK